MSFGVIRDLPRGPAVARTLERLGADDRGVDEVQRHRVGAVQAWRYDRLRRETPLFPIRNG